MNCIGCHKPAKPVRLNHKSYFGGPVGDEYDIWVSDFACNCGCEWEHHGEMVECKQEEMGL